jgi:hypothetical protein
MDLEVPYFRQTYIGFQFHSMSNRTEFPWGTRQAILMVTIPLLAALPAKDRGGAAGAATWMMLFLFGQACPRG